MGIAILVGVAVVAFVAGLLVGRRNPAVANVAATVATDAKAAAKNIAGKV